MHRQVGLFVLIGLLQYVLDAAVFWLSLTVGAPLIAANLIGRISGAICGYLLNNRYTFGHDRSADPGRIVRFIGYWLFMTVLSTALLAWADARWNTTDQDSTAVLIKLAVEAVLVTLSFALAKWVVFRK